MREYSLGSAKGGAGGDAQGAPFDQAMKGYPYAYLPGQAPATTPKTIINGWGTKDFVNMDASRQAYTGNAITEPIIEAATANTYKLAWGPVVKGGVVLETSDAGEAAGTPCDYIVLDADGKEVYAGHFDSTAAAGVTTELAARLVNYTLTAGMRIKYCYDNKFIPQEQMPSVTMRMVSRPVQAKVRSIEIVYSKLAAYTA